MCKIQEIRKVQPLKMIMAVLNMKTMMSTVKKMTTKVMIMMMKTTRENHGKRMKFSGTFGTRSSTYASEEITQTAMPTIYNTTKNNSREELFAL